MAARPVTRGIDAKPVRVSAILGGDIRLEASTYLREGYGLTRLAKQVPGHTSLGELADIWQPSRLTGYTVPEGKGLPFLAAGQVFEDFPRVRKWLAKPFVPQLESRYVDRSWLLLTCSGVVGNVTAVYPHHLNTVITHDLLRIVPKNPAEYGWLYAYMKTQFFMQVAQAAQYGHMIKHIEVAHASAFPVIMPEGAVRREIGDKAVKAIRLRTRAWDLRDNAFTLFEKYMNACQLDELQPGDVNAGLISVSAVLPNRMRLDADSYVGTIGEIDKLIDEHEWNYLGDIVASIAEPPRFKRLYGNSDVPFVGISELFDVNARPTKYIYAKLVKDWQQYVLKPGVLVMARSGQKYGILGHVLMLTENHANMMGSEHLTRILPDENRMRSGYLLAFLNDPLIGRPSVVRHAYGTSVPELAPGDLKRIRVPRFGEEKEAAIADLMDESVRLSAEADRTENDAIRLAQNQIETAIGLSSVTE